jgi:hypothetical protein
MSVDLPEEALRIYMCMEEIPSVISIVGINELNKLWINSDRDDDSMVSQLVAKHLYPKETMK